MIDFNQREQEAKFKTRLKYAAEQGILLFTKWFLVLVLAFIVFNYITNLYQMAMNGQQAAQLILEYQTKGHLPKLPIPTVGEQK